MRFEFNFSFDIPVASPLSLLDFRIFKMIQ